MALQKHLVFNGNNQPQWSPALQNAPSFSKLAVSKKRLNLKDSINGTQNFFYVVDHFLNDLACQELIHQFDQTTAEPVGVDGYVVAKDSIGSYRTNAWALDLAQKLTAGFFQVLQAEKTFTPFVEEKEIFRSNAGEDIAIPTLPKNM